MKELALEDNRIKDKSNEYKYLFSMVVIIL